MQDAMQDTVHDEHKQTEMPTPPKVLCHKHNRQSAQSVNDDKDVKEQERVCVWSLRRTMSTQWSVNERLKHEEEGGKGICYL